MKTLFGPLIRPVLVLFILMTVITGVIYPIVVTAIGHASFEPQASGSLLVRNGKLVGSALIGQQFDAPYYFWGRLSARRIPNTLSPSPVWATGWSACAEILHSELNPLR
jgi:K+-transporting ATPase c subunit